MSKKTNMIKIIGVACTIIGAGLTLIQNKIDDIKLEETVSEEVRKQLENKSEE